jgi:hypothetical protein
MMKRILVILSFVLLIALFGCTAKTSKVAPESHANAYFTTFENLVSFGPAKTRDIKYLAFDFSNLDSDDLDQFVGMIKEFCKNSHYTYLEGTFDELIEKGYISTYELQDGTMMPVGFIDGVLVQITTISTAEFEIVSTMTMWKGNLGANGATYTTTYENGTWNVEFTDLWIS